MRLHLVATDPETAPSRFVAEDEPLPPSKRAEVVVIPFDEWDEAGRPTMIVVG